MKDKIEAVIFDMDGVIIDSESIWKRAEREVFSSVGVQLPDDLCRVTESMTTAEVTKFWFDRQPWENESLNEIENKVIKRVSLLIKEEGKAIRGIEKILRRLKSKGFRIGLATNSPAVLIPVVLEKLNIEKYFDAFSSAQYEIEGKPNPAVYLTVANKLNSEPESCIAIEDSFSGLLAAKKAGMKTILFFNKTSGKVECEFADFKVANYDEIDMEQLK